MIARLPEPGYFSEDEGPSLHRPLTDVVRLALVEGRFEHAWAAALELYDQDFSTRLLRRVAIVVVQCRADNGLHSLSSCRGELCWIEIAGALIEEGDLAGAEQVISGQLACSGERGRLLTDLPLAAAADDPGALRDGCARWSALLGLSLTARTRRGWSRRLSPRSMTPAGSRWIFAGSSL